MSKRISRQLDPVQRRTIALNFSRGKPPVEISRKTGIPVKIVEGYIRENHGART